MANSSAYDVKKRLLEIQDELTKEFEDKPDKKSKIMCEIREPNSHEVNEIIYLLKELQLSQHKILNVLIEINKKIRAF